MEFTPFVVALASLILLAVTSLRFGVDSRDGFPSKERDLAAGGLVWKSSAARDRFLASEARKARQQRLATAG